MTKFRPHRVDHGPWKERDMYVARKWGDFHVPGTNYVGPGNPVDDFPPIGQTDELAHKHDIEYGELQDIDMNPYIYYNEADEKFYNVPKEEYLGKAADAVWYTKKKIAKHIDPKEAKYKRIQATGDLISKFAQRRSRQGNAWRTI